MGPGLTLRSGRGREKPGDHPCGEGTVPGGRCDRRGGLAVGRVGNMLGEPGVSATGGIFLPLPTPPSRLYVFCRSPRLPAPFGFSLHERDLAPSRGHNLGNGSLTSKTVGQMHPRLPHRSWPRLSAQLRSTGTQGCAADDLVACRVAVLVRNHLLGGASGSSLPGPERRCLIAGDRTLSEHAEL